MQKLWGNFTVIFPSQILRHVESPPPTPSHVTLLLMQGEEPGNLRSREDQVPRLWSLRLKWLEAGRACTDLSLAARVLGCDWRHWACWHCSCGCTWERPQRSAVPGCRPERDKVWSPPRKSGSGRGTWSKTLEKGCRWWGFWGSGGTEPWGNFQFMHTPVPMQETHSLFCWVKKSSLCLSPFHHRQNQKSATLWPLRVDSAWPPEWEWLSGWFPSATRMPRIWPLV